MQIIFLDNNIFDFLFKNKIRLSDEFPRGDFSLFIIREIELEIATTPHELNLFISENMKACKISVDSHFGFYCDDHPAHQQRNGGFNEGRFITSQERTFINEYRNKIGTTKKKNGLYKNETDIALAARSLRPNTFVISMDVKTGPLRYAQDKGGNVILFTQEHYEESNLSFGEFIRSGMLL